VNTNRREFIERIGATAMLGAIPAAAFEPLASLARSSPGAAAEWDFSWTNALKGKKHKALFDCAEVESGFGVWRASIWEGQYQETLGAKPAEIKTVLVLRHNAVVLAFNQALWDQAKIGQENKVTHPLTQQGTDRNPALLSSSRNEIAAQFDPFALPNFIAHGGIVLACNLALQFFAGGWAQRAGISAEDATKRATTSLVPGVILMPSGVMACVRAQQEGCVYVKAS
jgi:hypothetical protein